LTLLEPRTAQSQSRSLGIRLCLHSIGYWFIGLPGETLADVNPGRGISGAEIVEAGIESLPFSRQVNSFLCIQDIQHLL
jgi:hypothetical protein